MSMRLVVEVKQKCGGGSFFPERFDDAARRWLCGPQRHVAGPVGLARQPRLVPWAVSALPGHGCQRPVSAPPAAYVWT